MFYSVAAFKTLQQQHPLLPFLPTTFFLAKEGYPFSKQFLFGRGEKEGGRKDGTEFLDYTYFPHPRFSKHLHQLTPQRTSISKLVLSVYILHKSRLMYIQTELNLNTHSSLRNQKIVYSHVLQLPEDRENMMQLLQSKQNSEMPTESQTLLNINSNNTMQP